MPSDNAALALQDISNNCNYALAFVAGLSFEAFQADRMRFYAVTRALEIISEAARRLPSDVRERHPDLPWRAIMGAGNVYRHNYDNVAADFIWRTLHQDLPPLRAVMMKEIERLDGATD